MLLGVLLITKEWDVLEWVIFIVLLPHRCYLQKNEKDLFLSNICLFYITMFNNYCIFILYAYINQCYKNTTETARLPGISILRFHSFYHIKEVFSQTNPINGYIWIEGEILSEVFFDIYLNKLLLFPWKKNYIHSTK